MPQSGTTSRRRKTAPKEVQTLNLSAPTRADGSVHANLGSVVEKRFGKITLYADQERKKPLATVHHTDDKQVSNIGTPLRNYIFSIVDGAFSGTGQGPDGSAMFVRDNFDVVQKTTQNNLKELWLEAIPQDGARASVKGYLANVGSLVTSLSLRADWVQLSEAEYGLTKVKTRNRKKEAETPTVFI